MSTNTEYTNAQFNDAKVRITKVYESIMQQSGSGRKHIFSSVADFVNFENYASAINIYKDSDGVNHCQIMIIYTRGRSSVALAFLPVFDLRSIPQEERPTIGNKGMMRWSGDPYSNEFYRYYDGQEMIVTTEAGTGNPILRIEALEEGKFGVAYGEFSY